jgi:hypothetical protein
LVIGGIVMIIVIKDALVCRTFPDAGAYIYDQMMANIDTTDSYIWDMAEVSELPSMFLNMCLGKFIKEKGGDFVKSRVRFRNINKSQAYRIVDYVKKMSSAQ